MLCLQASMPKQYLPLLGQPIGMYSMQTLCSMPEMGELVIVCDPSYQASASSSCVRVRSRNLDDTKLLQLCNSATFRKLRYCGCQPQEVFQEFYDQLPEQLPLKFAQPGAERQDSVFNGFEVGPAECMSTGQTLSHAKQAHLWPLTLVQCAGLRPERSLGRHPRLSSATGEGR